MDEVLAKSPLPLIGICGGLGSSTAEVQIILFIDKNKDPHIRIRQHKNQNANERKGRPSLIYRIRRLCQENISR